MELIDEEEKKEVASRARDLVSFCHSEIRVNKMMWMTYNRHKQTWYRALRVNNSLYRVINQTIQ